MRKIIVLLLSCVGVQYVAAQESSAPQVVDSTAVDAFDSLQLDSPEGLKVKEEKEVIVVGYGAQKKATLTGAISSVKAKDIEAIPQGRVESVLQGRTSGVTVAASAGQPGSPSTIRVRGITTFDVDNKGGNDPLWVVDGIAITGGIGFLNQSDIESMEVLKDGASAAIYGVSAARGVVLVTTKKGKAGKITIGYNGSYGISSAARKLDLLNATEYASIMNERSIGGGGLIKYANPSDYGEGTDWQDQIFNTASRTSHDFSACCTTTNIQHYFELKC